MIDLRPQLMTQAHEMAMAHLDVARSYTSEQNQEQAQAHRLRALALEMLAAEVCLPNVQPTHAVLHRSAATIALNLGLNTLAFDLASQGLAGHVPMQIRDELREVQAKATAPSPSTQGDSPNS